jgi:hypothetical protein
MEFGDRNQINRREAMKIFESRFVGGELLCETCENDFHAAVRQRESKELTPDSMKQGPLWKTRACSGGPRVNGGSAFDQMQMTATPVLFEHAASFLRQHGRDIDADRCKPSKR